MPASKPPKPTRRVEMWPLERFQSALVNPKDHDIGAITVSYGRHGMIEIPAVDDRTDRLLAGHGRVEALVKMRELGESPPGGITVTKDGRWWTPTLVGSETEDDTQATEYVLTSNQLTLLGGYHEADLLDALKDLQTALDGLGTTGFTEEDMDYLAKQLEELPDPEAGDTDSKLEALVYRVVVSVKDEADQRELIEQLEGEGYTCKAVMS